MASVDITAYDTVVKGVNSPNCYIRSEAHLIDGLYHRQGISDKMSEDRYVRLIADWIARWAAAYPMAGTIYVDSAAKLFRAGLRDELERRGLRRFSVHPFTAMLINGGRFRVAAHMREWLRAYEDAVWDPAAYERGEWERLDDGSFPVDCLDSAEYGMYPYRRFLE